MTPPRWFPCEHPERPPSAKDPAVLHPPGSCRACVIAVEASIARAPEDALKVSNGFTGETLADYLRLSMEAARP